MVISICIIHKPYQMELISGLKTNTEKCSNQVKSNQNAYEKESSCLPNISRQ